LTDAEGTVIARSGTDDEGRFAIESPITARAVTVLAQSEDPHHDVAVAVDPVGRRTHGLRAALGAPGEPLELVATEADPLGSAGAFHILDTMLRGVVAVRQWSGRILPPLFAYWGRGVTTTWSYYRGERPAGSGRYCLELLGGEAGRQAESDTDEHDEGIVLHELGHFAMELLSTDSSPGGNHPAGYLIDPGLAWEEGRASWFATAVLGRPHYQDTIGLEPRGNMRVDHDLERGHDGPRGVGSEQGVAEILWDLADGAGGLPDADGDPVAIGPAAVFGAMVDLREQPGAYPAITTFLRFLVDRGLVTEAAVRQLLAAGGHPEHLLPQRDAADWFVDLSVPGASSGKIDGFSNPAPSGGPNRPENGVDAVAVYRVRVTERARLAVQLRIFGTGRVRDRQDLDLELRDTRAALLASARSEARVEAINHVVEPGYYVVYVRDGGNGNRAGYELRVWTEGL
jgi:hypothetical protein